MMSDSKLVWRCRRGIRELDVLFGRYLESDYPGLSTDDKLSFQKLLEVQDPVIMDWLFGKYSPEDADLIDLIEKLKRLSGLKDS